MNRAIYRGYLIVTRMVDVWVALIESRDQKQMLGSPDVTAKLDEGEEICIVRAKRRIDEEIAKAEAARPKN